jgi:hypothetical protein
VRALNGLKSRYVSTGSIAALLLQDLHGRFAGVLRIFQNLLFGSCFLLGGLVIFHGKTIYFFCIAVTNIDSRKLLFQQVFNRQRLMLPLLSHFIAFTFLPLTLMDSISGNSPSLLAVNMKEIQGVLSL